MASFVRKMWIIINRLYFKSLNIEFGNNMRVCNRLPIIMKGSASISIGESFTFSSGGFYNPLSRNIKGTIEIENGAKISIGNNVGISSSCLWIYEYLLIGNNVKIGGDCILLDSDCHSLKYIERRSGKTDRVNASKAGIEIGDDVLIGTRCIILKGVKIGDRSIIGSGSVVTKSIPSDCIAAGNPCKVIRKINSNE